MYQVLLIEDSADVFEVVEDSLAGMCRVDHCASLAEADEICRERNFDMIIADIDLPDGNGIEFCKKIIERQSPSPPIFVITGEGRIDSKVHSFAIGVVDYLVKPFEPRELRARVRVRLSEKNEH